MNDPDLDAEFERIISHWDEQAADPQAADARAGDAPDAQAGDAPDAEAEPDVRAGVEAPPADPPAASAGLSLSIAPLTPHVWRGQPTTPDDADAAEAAESDEDEHFEPPTLSELPNAEDDPMFWAIVVGLGGGPLLLLYLLIFDRDGSGWWVATALAMTVVGFVMLVLRGGSDRDPFDDGTRV